MPRRKPDTTTAISFDGLTDAVTNLTGTLILMVVLILGVTRAARLDEAPSGGGPIPIEPLCEELHRMETQIRLMDANVGQIDGELLELEQRVDRLRQKSSFRPPPDFRRDRGDRVAAGSDKPGKIDALPVSLDRRRDVP